MAELVARIDGLCIMVYNGLQHTDAVDYSTAVGPSRGAERGIYAVRIQMDELLVDAGDQCEEYDSDVGYISGMPSIPSMQLLLKPCVTAVGGARRIFSISPLRLLRIPG
jgi:hypothetical protein